MVKRAIVLLLVLAVVALSFGAAKAADGFRSLKPSAADKQVNLQVSGKSRAYYLLEPGAEIEISVKGPSKLKIHSRAVLEAKQDSLPYAFLMQRKGAKKATRIEHTTRPAEKVLLPEENGKGVGLARTRIVDVPRGRQTYVISLPKEEKARLLMRFFVETNEFTSGTKVVPMTPAEYSSAVDLVSKEETSSYYRIGTGHNVSLKLIGPATLKVLTRIEYVENMNGRQKWKVRVMEDGNVKGTYSLSSKKSDVTTYKDVTPYVPSRAETFYVEVPAGEHSYEFTLPENHRTVLLRFLLPKTDLAKE